VLAIEKTRCARDKRMGIGEDVWHCDWQACRDVPRYLGRDAGGRCDLGSVANVTLSNVGERSA